MSKFERFPSDTQKEIPSVDKGQERKGTERRMQVDEEAKRFQEGDQELLAQLEKERADLDREVEAAAASIKSIEASLQDATGEPSSEEDGIRTEIIDSIKNSAQYLFRIGAAGACLMALASLGPDQVSWQIGAAFSGVAIAVSAAGAAFEFFKTGALLTQRYFNKGEAAQLTAS